MRYRARPSLTVAAALLVGGGPLLAQAADAPRDRGANAQGVAPRRQAPLPRELKVVLVTNDAEGSQWLAETVRAALHSFGMPLELRHERTLPFSEPAWAFRLEGSTDWTFWIDLRAPDLLFIYVADARQQALLVRALPHAAGRPDPVVAEKVTEILYASTDGLLSGGELGVASSEPSPGRPGPAAPAARDSRAPLAGGEASWRLRLAAFYFGELFATGASLLHGPGMSFSAAAPSPAPWRWFAELTAQYASTRAEASRLSVGLDVIRAYTVIGVTRSAGWPVRSGVGVGLDLSHIDPGSSAPNAQLRDERWSARALLRTEVELGVVAPLYVNLNADFELTDPSYQGVVASRTTTLLDVHRVRPGLHLGVSF